MSREIKFRAWDKSSKRMIPSHSLHRLSQKEDGIFAVEGSIGKEIVVTFHGDLILEQFIGIKDKKHVECYFGDKVKHDNGDIGYIEWDEGRCGVCFVWPHSKYDTKSYPIANSDYIDFEVIGNIHSEKESCEEKA